MNSANFKKNTKPGVPAFRSYLSDLCQSDQWPLLEALPVTRDLGIQFGVSNVSAFRVLTGLRNDGVLWQSPNGRFYRTAARRLIETPLPLDCLLRRLEVWTEVSR